MNNSMLLFIYIRKWFQIVLSWSEMWHILFFFLTLA